MDNRFATALHVFPAASRRLASATISGFSTLQSPGEEGRPEHCTAAIKTEGNARASHPWDSVCIAGRRS